MALNMTEIVFLVEDDPDGGYNATLGESIFTSSDDMETLRKMVRDAVHCHFPEQQTRPKIIRLHKASVLTITVNGFISDRIKV